MTINSLKYQEKSPYYIAEFEQHFESVRVLEEKGFSSTLYFAYQRSKKIGTEFIDFDDIIWENDVEAIIKTLKENTIREFTISCRFCDLIDRLSDLEKYECRMTGIEKIKTPFTNFDGSMKKINAIKMEIF